MLLLPQFNKLLILPEITKSGANLQHIPQFHNTQPKLFSLFSLLSTDYATGCGG